MKVENSLRQVAFIGAGNMGAAMARRVAQGGYPLLVCDRSETVRQTFQSEGFAVTDTPAGCAAADLIVVLVANDEQVKAVTLGPQGIVSALDGQHHPLVCIMSTVLPETMVDVAQALTARGARVIDAPVTGGVAGALRGTLTILLAGEAADIETATPVMQCMGTRIFHCGGHGAAQVVKIVNNMVGIANIYLMAEAYELASGYGVTPESLAPILEVGSGRNFLTQDAELAQGHFQALARSREIFDSLADIIRKDLELAQQLAGDKSLSLPVLNSVAAGLEDIPGAVFERWQKLAGI